MEKSERYELIEQYLSNQLDPKERASFEAQLSENQELYEETQMHKDLALALKSEFRNTLESINKELNSSKNTKVGYYLKVTFNKWTIAASLLLLMSLGYVYLRNRLNLGNDLFEKYFIAPTSLSPEFSIERGLKDTLINYTQLQNILMQADNYFINGDFSAAIALLKTYPVELNEEKIFFQLGVLYIVSGKADLALSELNKISKYNLSDVIWYKAMAYLKLKNISSARTEIKKLSNDPKWKMQAESILAKL
jgi:tetratricopeptide (TPR) repeat protein